MDEPQANRGSAIAENEKEPGPTVQHEAKGPSNGTVFTRPDNRHRSIISDHSDTESTLHHHDGQSVRTQSVAGTDDTASVNSRTRFLSHRRQDSTLSLKSALRSYDDTEAQHRATGSYLSDLRAARNPGGSKPKKTAGRRAFEVACGIVEVLVTPLDVNGEKTSMKESSLNQLFKGHRRDESETSVVTEVPSAKNKTRMVSMPY